MGRNKQKQGEKVNPKVAEASRIRISNILEKFRASKDDEYIFEASLSNFERRFAHEACRKLGMKSKSHGKGDNRRLSIYKKRKGPPQEAVVEETLPCIKFSEEAEVVLQDLFTHYPPEDGEFGEQVAGKYSGKTDKSRGNKDDVFLKPIMSKEEIKKKVDSLASRIEKNPNLRKIVEARSKLPIASFQDVITSTIESNQVVLISGETGCGKTTQVPQFLLDSMWAKGEACKIVCTQPRRISATSVSERIANERGETAGNDVGYKIRLESRGGRQSSIIFCTNGVLLRVLVSKGSGKSNKKEAFYIPAKQNTDITHIVVDEIHERDRYSDFMLAIIREMLPSHPNLRLILMSATLDAERFSQYFGGCPIIRVPGFTYPVKTFYLEDVLAIVKSRENNHLSSAISTEVPELTDEDKVALDEAISLAWSNDEFDTLRDLISSEGVHNYQHSSTGLSPLMVFAGRGRVGDVCMLLSLGADCHLKDKDGKTALQLAEEEKQEETVEIIKKHSKSNRSGSVEGEQLLDKYLSTINPEMIDVALIEKLIRKICTDSSDGAILVFYPGWDEINRTRDRLQSNEFFRDSSRFLIISLHSMVPSAEQKKVFKRPPPGCRKIVLATNIAESSITIDDVVYVIDSGRMKEKSYDPYNNVSTLQSGWVSKASARQREGRAGRCQPGICYHLFSKLRAASLPEFQVPEIKRVPIEELCLQVKMLDPACKVADFLRKTLDPPVPETIRNAVIVLQDIGAFSLDEELTELGEKLGHLPVHPLTSKMLFFAILMNCLDPALTIACASDFRSPFTMPMLPKERKNADFAKQELASLYGGQSDQLAVIAAFECWKNAKQRGQESRFCSQYFVSTGTMHMLSGMRKQLQNELTRTGFISDDVSTSSLNARDPGILHAVLVAGMYPNVARMQPLLKGAKRCSVETGSGVKVRMHPQSMNFKLSFNKSNNRSLIVYDEITRGDGGMYMRNCSVIGPLPLLLLATEIAVAPGTDESDSEDSGSEEDEMKTDNKNSEKEKEEKIMASPENTVTVVVDRWLSFESMALDVAQIYCLRERLFAAILFKAMNPRQVLPEALGASVYATACILSYDGLSGISHPEESEELLALRASGTEIDNVESRSRGMLEPSAFLRSLMSHDSFRDTDRQFRRPNVGTSQNQPPFDARSGSNQSRGRGDPFQKPRVKKPKQ